MNVNRDRLVAPQPTPLASMPQLAAPQASPLAAAPNADGLPGNLQKSVILSGATTSRSEAVAQSKDPYPLNSVARRQGILPVATPANSQGQGPRGDTQAKAGN